MTTDGAFNPITLDAAAHAKAQASATLAIPPGWTPNFAADGDVYLPARQAMTVDQATASIGVGALTYAKSTAAAPGTFTTTSLPAKLEAGSWLKVSATGVTGFLAADLKRTA